MRLTGAEVIIECLLEEGVDTVFGYPGGQVIPLYDAIYEYKGRIRHILTAHEQGASRPGATNLVTGLATAYMDSSPVVAITGNVPLSLLGRDSFQEVDISGITMPITKHNYIVKDIEELADTVREAFRIAREGRPGPVLIDVPKDLQVGTVEYERKESEKVLPRVDRLEEKDIDRAVEMLKAAKRPMFYIGGGVIRSDASEELNKFLEKVDAPCCSTLMGLGSVSADNPRFTGMVGMHGTKLSNMSVNMCDLLVVIGARFSDRVISNGSTFARQAKVLQIDVDPAEINKNIYSHQHVIGDVKVILEKLLHRTPQLSHEEWMKVIEDNRRRFPLRITTESRRSREILAALERVLPEDNIISTEVGQHQMWAAQYLKSIRPRRYLTSGGLGTMGFGTGAAIGAQVSHPEARVVNIAGDGSFRMNCNELATIARYRLPIIILVMNNHCLGMVRQWQTLFYDKHYSETTLDTPIDWVALANAYGVKGMRLSADDDPEAVLKAAVELGEAVVVDCEIPTDDKVYPMVAPGASISDMIGFIDMGD